MTSAGQRGIALRPALLLQDRFAVGYEALPRPGQGGDEAGSLWRDGLWREALALAAHTSPGMLLLAMECSDDAVDARELARAARAAGAQPDEIVWLIDEAQAHAALDGTRARRAALRAEGFSVGVSGCRMSAATPDVIGALRPDVVVIAAEVTAEIATDPVLAARIAGCVVHVSRLEGRVIASGIDTDAQVQAYLDVGVQSGMGPLLGPPVVLDAAAVASGDEVVGPSWFRARGMRRFQARGDAFDPGSVVVSESRHEPAVEEANFARVLSEAAQTLQAERHPRRIAEVIADLLQRVVPGYRIALYEADHEARTLKPLVVGGYEAEELALISLPIDAGITGWAFARGVPYNCPDVNGHPLAAQIPGAKATADESIIVVPLVAGEIKLGVLDIWRPGTDAFSEYDLERAALFGYVAAAAWRNAQLYSELEERATTDSLTGMLNTRWWDQAAAREAAQAHRTGESIGVLLVDLDHFKRVNDTVGHAAGDALLRTVALALRSVVRVGDAAVRYGGDEFLLLLRHSDARGAARVARAAAKALAGVTTPLPDGSGVTASIGVAVFPEHGGDLDTVVRVADAAMYRAKAAGRNRVESAA